MSSSPTLFDLAPPPPEPERGKARRSDGETAKAAAANTNASRLENTVYQFMSLMYPEGFNTKELAERLGLDRVSISPRIKPLFDKGKVKKTGERRDGCEVWRAIK